MSGSKSSNSSTEKSVEVFTWETMKDALKSTSTKLAFDLAADRVHDAWKRLHAATEEDKIGQNMALVEQVERYAPLHEAMVNEAVHLVSGWNRKLPAEAEGREDWYLRDLPYALLSDSVALPLAVKSMCSHFYKKVREHGASFSWTDPANYPIACTGSGDVPCKFYPSIVPSIGDLCHECTRGEREENDQGSVGTFDNHGSLHDFPAHETPNKKGFDKLKPHHDKTGTKTVKSKEKDARTMNTRQLETAFSLDPYQEQDHTVSEAVLVGIYIG